MIYIAVFLLGCVIGWLVCERELWGFIDILDEPMTLFTWEIKETTTTKKRTKKE